jgi:DNA polymerase-3 subunit delta'
MRFGTYLEKRQPLVYKTFANALRDQRLAHAYLLSGEAGTPLKETAFFLAKSILCDRPDPLACEECRTCVRIDHGSYADLLFLDGQSGTIKKDDIQNVLANFARTALESKGLMIYIVHLAENMTPEATNSLLKFLEEPTKGTYAFLTSQNEARLLPTIVSRCETIRLLLIPRQDVIAEAEEEGLAPADAEILSYFCNSGLLAASEARTESYGRAKKDFLAALEALAGPPSAALYAFERDIIPTLAKKEDARYFLDMLSLAFKDAIAMESGQPIVMASYAKLIEPLTRLPHLGDSLREIMRARSLLDLNIGLPLIIAHLAYFIIKEN